MRLFYVLFLVISLFISAIFAESCTSSSDCPDGYYCSYGYCMPYPDSNYSDYPSKYSNEICCCGSALVLFGLLGAIIYTKNNK